jgi:glycopeptide antibiotics resistance protein
VSNGEFTIKRSDDGRNLIVYLADRATIETSSGFVSISDLKIGDRVTLVGGPNRDGSFTADAVVVCAETKENVTGQEIRSGQKQAADSFKAIKSRQIRAAGSDKANAWSLYIKVSAMLLIGLIWIGMLVFFRLRKKKNLVYLLFLTIFYVYFVKALDYTLFQYQSLIVLKHFAPNLMLRGQEAGESLNLIPLITLRQEDVRTSLLNILLTIPFGFGLPFITNLRFKKVVAAGILFSVGIELLQLITGLVASITFRIADINDVIFNTVGVATGYILFVTFVRIYRRIFRDWKIVKNPILRYIAERPQGSE